MWDPLLYSGSAAYYAVGRLPYPPETASALARELALDGRGRLLDLGCGPGSLTLLLSDLFEEAVGVDPDGAMLEEAARIAAARGRSNVRWVRAAAETLPPDLGRFRVASVAQSFHWMDRAAVAAKLRELLEPGGWLVHVGGNTHRGAPGAADLPGPPPPWAEIDALVAAYLGPVRRAGGGLLPEGTPSGEDEILVSAWFAGPTRLVVGGGEVVARSAEEVVASLFSLSSAAPHLFGQRLDEFQAELRALLARSSPSVFYERTEPVTLSLWQKAGGS